MPSIGGVPNDEPGSNRFTDPIRRFLAIEAASGVMLVLATLAALVWVNLGSLTSYESFWHSSLGWRSIGPLGTTSLVHLVNDALMCLFFFVVGLEIKHEWMEGALQDRAFARLPIVAAVGGMIVPACIYLLIAGGTSGAHGWGIPVATDIAFMIGVTALLGARVPLPVKTFLLALAIVDDLGAIVVIALFYSGQLHRMWLGVALVIVAGVAILSRRGNLPNVVFVALGIMLWYATWLSGVHATIAGVALAFVTPLHRNGRPLAQDLLDRLHAPANFVVVPLFALANAGVVLRGGLGPEGMRVGAGIVLGLVVGKAIGVFGASWLAIKCGYARLGTGMSWSDLFGAGCLAGIGFTMSLFITELAFVGPTRGLAHDAKIAILVASLIGATLGWLVFAVKRPPDNNVLDQA